jgi:hypothetical protein
MFSLYFHGKFDVVSVIFGIFFRNRKYCENTWKNWKFLSDAGSRLDKIFPITTFFLLPPKIKGKKNRLFFQQINKIYEDLYISCFLANFSTSKNNNFMRNILFKVIRMIEAQRDKDSF